MSRNFQWVKGGSSDGRKGYIIKFGYDIKIIRRIKSTIPAHLREWNPDKTYWWIHEYCERQINDIFPGFLEAVVAQKRLF